MKEAEGGKGVAVFMKLERTEEHSSKLVYQCVVCCVWHVSLYCMVCVCFGHRFAQLDLAATLQDNLRHKTVTESPELHVVLASSPAITDYTQQRREGEGDSPVKQEDELLSSAPPPTSLQLLANAYSSSDSDVES